MSRPLIFLGTTNLDTVFFTAALPAVGESVLGSIEEFGGGKGANQAVAAARLGAEPEFATFLGQDGAGERLQGLFAGYGVQTRKLRRISGAPSGRAVIFVDAKGSNFIGMDAGANEMFGAADVTEALADVPQDAVMVVEMGLPVEACRAAFDQKGGRFLIFNPAPVREQLTEADCAAIDIITPNETEAADLTGMPVDSAEQALAAAECLHERGIKGVAITLGAGGVVYCDAGRRIHQAAFEVRAIDTTAAGDAFNGGLGVAIAQGMEIEDALRFAVAVAGLCVTKKGAQQSMPSRSEVQELLSGQRMA